MKAPKVFDIEEKKSEPPVDVEKEEAKRRNFAGDLRTYVSAWRHDKASWKFNKRLQVYLLKSCFDSEKIDKQLFHDVLPYISSVTGGARIALIQECDRYMEAGDSVEPTTEVRRAKKVKSAFQKETEKRAVEGGN